MTPSKTKKYPARRRAYYKRHKPRLLAEAAAKWREDGRNKYLLEKYGITAAQYDAMLVSQKGVCKICSGVNENGDSLAVDHDHSTGEIRGLLCHLCNLVVGLLNDDPDRALVVAAYLKQ